MFIWLIYGVGGGREFEKTCLYDICTLPLGESDSNLLLFSNEITLVFVMSAFMLVFIVNNKIMSGLQNITDRHIFCTR